MMVSNVVCRLCLSTNEVFSVFDKRIHNNINSIIFVTTNVEISPSDKISQKVCKVCSQLAVQAFRFREKCQQSDQILKKQLENENVPEQQQLKVCKQEITEDSLDETPQPLSDTKQSIATSPKLYTVKDVSLPKQSELDEDVSSRTVLNDGITKQADSLNHIVSTSQEIQDVATISNAKHENEKLSEIPNACVNIHVSPKHKKTRKRKSKYEYDETWPNTYQRIKKRKVLNNNSRNLTSDGQHESNKRRRYTRCKFCSVCVKHFKSVEEQQYHYLLYHGINTSKVSKFTILKECKVSLCRIDEDEDVKKRYASALNKKVLTTKDVPYAEGKCNETNLISPIISNSQRSMSTNLATSPNTQSIISKHANCTTVDAAAAEINVNDLCNKNDSNSSSGIELLTAQQNLCIFKELYILNGIPTVTDADNNSSEILPKDVLPSMDTLHLIKTLLTRYACKHRFTTHIENSVVQMEDMHILKKITKEVAMFKIPIAMSHGDTVTVDYSDRIDVKTEPNLYNTWHNLTALDTGHKKPSNLEYLKLRARRKPRNPSSNNDNNVQPTASSQQLTTNNENLQATTTTTTNSMPLQVHFKIDVNPQISNSDQGKMPLDLSTTNYDRSIIIDSSLSTTSSAKLNGSIPTTTNVVKKTHIGGTSLNANNNEQNLSTPNLSIPYEYPNTIGGNNSNETSSNVNPHEVRDSSVPKPAYLADYTSCSSETVDHIDHPQLQTFNGQLPQVCSTFTSPKFNEPPETVANLQLVPVPERPTSHALHDVGTIHSNASQISVDYTNVHVRNEPVSQVRSTVISSCRSGTVANVNDNNNQRRPVVVPHATSINANGTPPPHSNTNYQSVHIPDSSPLQSHISNTVFSMNYRHGSVQHINHQQLPVPSRTISHVPNTATSMINGHGTPQQNMVNHQNVQVPNQLQKQPLVADTVTPDDFHRALENLQQQPFLYQPNPLSTPAANNNINNNIAACNFNTLSTPSGYVTYQNGRVPHQPASYRTDHAVAALNHSHGTVLPSYNARCSNDNSYSNMQALSNINLTSSQEGHLSSYASVLMNSLRSSHLYDQQTMQQAFNRSTYPVITNFNAYNM